MLFITATYKLSHLQNQPFTILNVEGEEGGRLKWKERFKRKLRTVIKKINDAFRKYVTF